MEIEQIEVNEIYQLHFTNNSKNIEISPCDLLSEGFANKYTSTRWAAHNGKHIRVVNTKPSHSFVKFHFLDDPKNITATIHAHFFERISSQTQKSTCQCNIWLFGCSCGAFEAGL